MYLQANLWDRAGDVVAAANDGRITGVSKTLGGLFRQALGQNCGRPFARRRAGYPQAEELNCHTMDMVIPCIASGETASPTPPQ